MKLRKPVTTAALVCATLVIAGCGPDGTPATAPAASAPASAAKPTGEPSTQPTPAPASSPAGAGTHSATPATSAAGTANGKPAAELQPCSSAEKHSDVKAELAELDTSGNPRMGAVVKLTNTTGQDCVIYGQPDVRIDNGGAAFAKLASAALGTAKFGTDKAHGVVLRSGSALYQPVAWWASPPATDTPNAACTTGTMLVIAASQEALVLPVAVKDLRVCPEKQQGSVQARLGLPQANPADAKAQLKSAAK
ncbi:DUF4232 domain-containing protein [Kitasatospora sp. NPDC096147]|uniref:DUF4232 domain-containing protein n=1 Tax=Kitasatospora sp. NPDC096147 TaxID=3364093 RepID=UPI003824A0E7